MGIKTGAAPKIRKLALRHPELTHSEIARSVGCTPGNVTTVLKTFLGTTTDSQLAEFQSNKADVFDAIQFRLLSSLTEEKIRNTKPMEAITGAAILEDKARLVRGQATGILASINVMLDLVEAIKAKANQ